MPEKKNAVVAPSFCTEHHMILQAEYGLGSLQNARKKNAVVAPSIFCENRVILQAEYGLGSQNNGNNKRRSRFLFPMNIEVECYDSFAPLQMGCLPLIHLYIYIYIERERER